MEMRSKEKPVNERERKRGHREPKESGNSRGRVAVCGRDRKTERKNGESKQDDPKT